MTLRRHESHSPMNYRLLAMLCALGCSSAAIGQSTQLEVDLVTRETLKSSGTGRALTVIAADPE